MGNRYLIIRFFFSPNNSVFHPITQSSFASHCPSRRIKKGSSAFLRRYPQEFRFTPVSFYGETLSTTGMVIDSPGLAYWMTLISPM